MICVLGAPGSGKSTHCGRLAKEFGCVHLSAGQALKAAAKGSGPDSDKIRECVSSATLVPSETVIWVLLESAETDANTLLFGPKSQSMLA